MNINSTFSRSCFRFFCAGLFSAIFVVAIAETSEARDRHSGRHNSSSYGHGGHGNHGGHRSHRVRHNFGHHGGHQRRHYSGHHGFNGYSFFAGAITGHAASYLFRPYSYPRHYYGRTAYVTRPQVTVINPPATIRQVGATVAGNSCLQTREYQTTVIVGNREVDAYGTACLQPDGSWMRGPVKLPPEYQ